MPDRRHLDDATGPIHLIGHSYGGAIAFKIATASPFAHRIRSLTLIEPVLPTLLRESDADRRLHDVSRGSRARFPRPLERIGAGGDRQIHRVLERLRPARAAAGERAASHDRARRKAGVRFHRGARRRARPDRGGRLARADAAVLGRTIALSDPAHRRAARIHHRRRAIEASAGGRPHAAADACVDSSIPRSQHISRAPTNSPT